MAISSTFQLVTSWLTVDNGIALDAVRCIVGLYSDGLVVRWRGDVGGHVGVTVLDDFPVGMVVVTEFDVWKDRVDHVYVGSVHRVTATMGQVGCGEDVPSLKNLIKTRTFELIYID